jgi:hypothetical protein
MSELLTLDAIRLWFARFTQTYYLSHILSTAQLNPLIQCSNTSSIPFSYFSFGTWNSDQVHSHCSSSTASSSSRLHHSAFLQLWSSLKASWKSSSSSSLSLMPNLRSHATCWTAFPTHSHRHPRPQLLQLLLRLHNVAVQSSSETNHHWQSIGLLCQRMVYQAGPLERKHAQHNFFWALDVRRRYYLRVKIITSRAKLVSLL